MIYAYANIIVKNPESLAAYREHASKALAKHGGRVVQAAQKLTLLEGEMPHEGLGVILEFQSAEGAKAWMGDESLAEVHALRRGAGQSNIVLLG